MSDIPKRTPGILPSFLLRTIVLALAWWIFTGGDNTSLALGVPVALAAAALSISLAPPRPTGLRIARLLPYSVYFVTKSITGGLDVARRALSPSMPINPALFDYQVRLTGDTPRMVFANTISLLPGTLSARLIGETLQVHALDATTSVQADLHELEARVGALFGQHIVGDVSV